MADDKILDRVAKLLALAERADISGGRNNLGGGRRQVGG